jgi:hypothetical protein
LKQKLDLMFREPCAAEAIEEGRIARKSPVTVFEARDRRLAAVDLLPELGLSQTLPFAHGPEEAAESRMTRRPLRIPFVSGQDSLCLRFFASSLRTRHDDALCSTDSQFA